MFPFDLGLSAIINAQRILREIEEEKKAKSNIKIYKFPEYTPIVKKRKWYQLL